MAIAPAGTAGPVAAGTAGGTAVADIVAGEVAVGTAPEGTAEGADIVPKAADTAVADTTSERRQKIPRDSARRSQIKPLSSFS